MRRAIPYVLFAGLAFVAAVAVVSADAEPPPPAKLIRASSAMYVRPPAVCPGHRAGLRWYRDRYNQHRRTQRLELAPPLVRYDCEATIRRAKDWRSRAEGERYAATEYLAHHYRWQDWLPDKWQRIGACETGYGKRPGNWQHRSSGYQGAFGFANQSWDSFVPYANPDAGPYPSEAYLATPWQQYEVALAIYRRYGLSGWGCRGA